MAESLFLTVNILDHFLEIRTIAITKLQLVGLATFLVATKFEETYASSVKEIAYLADNQYTVEEILKAEKYRNERCGSHRRQAMSSVADMAHTDDDEAEE